VRALGFTFLLSLSAAAAPFSWTGAAGNGRWADAGNWSGGAVPPDDGTADVIVPAGGAIALDGVRVISSLAVSAASDVTLQAGAQPQSALVLNGSGLSRGARGKLIVQVPVLGSGAVSLSGFETQNTLANATTFDLKSALWNGATNVSQATLAASGDALPAGTALVLGAGSVLDAKGQTISVGSLAGAGSVINSVAAKATLFVGADGSDSAFSGTLGATLADQTANGFVDLVKVGPGTLTASGQLNLGGSSFGLVRVQEGTLLVTGAVAGPMPIVVVGASSAQQGTVSGTGSVGWLWTANNPVPGATIRPGLPSAKGILRASNCDLRHGTLALRLSAYATAGADFDQLDCGTGYLAFDADSEVVIDLGGLTSVGGPVPIALYGVGGSPAALQPSQIRLLNNPARLVASLAVGKQALTLTVKAANPATAPLFYLTPAHGLVTSERGKTASFTVALGHAPSGVVTMPVASNNPAEGLAAPASLTFTPLTWNLPQTVAVRGIDDAAADGNVAYAIVLGPCVSSDASFSGKSPGSVTAVNLDDDLITVSPVGGLVSQPLGAARFTVTFHGPLAAGQEMWLQFRSSDAASAWAAPELLHLAGANAPPAAQAVGLTGQHRLVVGCAPYTVSAFAVLSGDPLYNGFELPDVSACNLGNRPPVAADLSFAVGPLSPLSVTAALLAQAADPDGDPLVAQLVAAPAHGAVSISPDGSFTYTPAAGYAGADSFTYAASDGLLSSAAATVSLQVAAAPPPSASPDSYPAQAGTTLSVAAPGVLGNDTDPRGLPLSAVLVAGPQHGTLALNADGSFNYLPADGFTGDDGFTYTATDGASSSANAEVVIPVAAQPPVESARLTLTGEGGDTPGAARTLHAEIVNTGNTLLDGARLVLHPQGLSLDAAATEGAALTMEGATVFLPQLAPGQTVLVSVAARLSGTPGAEAGSSALVEGASGEALSAPQQSWVRVSRLRFDAGGCGCNGANAGGALAWLGTLIAFRRRRRSTLPGRNHPHLRHRLVARDLRLGFFSPAQRIDRDHGDLLRPVAKAHVGVELAGRSDLHRLALHVDAAAGGHAAGERDGAAVGLVAGPLDREQHLLQRRGGLVEDALVLHAGELPLAHPHRLAGGGHLHRACGRSNHHGLAFGGEQEMAAGAVRDRRAVLHLERDVPLARLDVGLDAAVDAGAQEAGGDGGEAQLAAVVQLDANAVDGELGLGIRVRPDAIADANALAGSGRAPRAAAPLQLHGATASGEHRRGGLGLRGRRLCARRRGGRRSLGVAPAGRAADGEDKQQGCGDAHDSSYRGVTGPGAMP
jgi:Big-like domain-containing protein